MALNDLTPELRMRLSRAERGVGLFVAAATLLLVAGFAYYLYHTAKNKGWFKTKAPFFTYVEDATGLKMGGPVKMMGFDVGKITKITAEAPGMDYNVYVEFYVEGDKIGYVWTDSRVKVVSADFLGGRYLEVLKGGWDGYTNANGTKKDLHATYEQKGDKLTGIWLDKVGVYTNVMLHNKPYWLLSDETPALTKQAERLVGQAEAALPVILGMTNQLYAALKNFMQLSSNLDQSIAGMQPIVSNISTVTTRLTGGPGSLGEMLLPTNVSTQLTLTLAAARQTLTNLNQTVVGARQTLASAESTMANADQTLLSVRTTVTNTEESLDLLVSNLNMSLTNLVGITSNLNSQVQANSNILSSISGAVISANELMEGLKRHWLLRSAFKEEKEDKTNKPPARPASPSRGGFGR